MSLLGSPEITPSVPKKGIDLFQDPEIELSPFRQRYVKKSVTVRQIAVDAAVLTYTMLARTGEDAARSVDHLRGAD